MLVVLVFEEDVLGVNAPQSEGSLEEKQSFCDGLICEWDVYYAGELVMCFGDFNEYIGRHIDGIDGVHGGYGVCQWNLKGRMLLVLSGERIMHVK